MSDAIRKPLLDRALALLAAPFLLGRQAIEAITPVAEPLRPALRPIPIPPPEHAVKRRG
ncbi:MAG: hypothetical protein WCL47_07150 [Holophagaceae bacterium]